MNTFAPAGYDQARNRKCREFPTQDEHYTPISYLSMKGGWDAKDSLEHHIEECAAHLDSEGLFHSCRNRIALPSHTSGTLVPYIIVYPSPSDISAPPPPFRRVFIISGDRVILSGSWFLDYGLRSMIGLATSCTMVPWWIKRSAFWSHFRMLSWLVRIVG